MTDRKEMVFTINEGNGIFTTINNTVYYLNNGDLNIEINDSENFIIYGMMCDVEHWELSKFKKEREKDFFERIDQSYTANEWLEILKEKDTN